MAEIVSSAVVQETVSQILTGLVHKREEKSEAKESMERLEMAHIKLDAALEISNKWIIHDASLLRWRKKLKRAAQECDDTLHKCKQRILEEEHMEQEVSNASFPKRIKHATKQFIFSAFSRNSNESNRSMVTRFEWYADGASEFLRFVELGGTPRRHMPFASLVRQLMAGKELHHRIVRGNEHPSLLLWLAPFRTADHGLEATLKIIQKYSNAPENNFFLGAMLQVSENTDIVGIIIKCLQLFLPHFQSTVELIKKEFFELPTQDLLWVPHVDLFERKHWDNLHSFSTQWFRPDPLCCKQQDQSKLHRTRNLSMAGLADASLEPIIEVNLQCQVPYSEYNKQRASPSECKNSLRVGLLYSPHSSSEDKLPAGKSSAVAGIHGREQHCLHTDITLEELIETMLPKAIDYFHQNIQATAYQMLWRSKHGTAYIQVEKASMDTPGSWRTVRRSRKGKLVQLQDQELGSRTHMVAQFLNSWVAHAPTRLRGLILNWVQKEMEIQLRHQRYT